MIMLLTAHHPSSLSIAIHLFPLPVQNSSCLSPARCHRQQEFATMDVLECPLQLLIAGFFISVVAVISRCIALYVLE